MAFSRVKVETMEVGMAMEAMRTERRSRMKSMTTRLARTAPKSRCSSRESMEALMKTDWSLMIRSFMSGGRVFATASRRFLMASITLTVLVPVCRLMSRLTASSPSKWFQVRGSA